MVAEWVPGSGLLKGCREGESAYLYSRKHLCRAGAESGWNGPSRPDAKTLLHAAQQFQISFILQEPMN